MLDWVLLNEPDNPILLSTANDYFLKPFFKYIDPISK
jgi:hypothetical protein